MADGASYGNDYGFDEGSWLFGATPFEVPANYGIPEQQQIPDFNYTMGAPTNTDPFGVAYGGIQPPDIQVPIDPWWPEPPDFNGGYPGNAGNGGNWFIPVNPGYPEYPGISSNTSGWPSTGNGNTVAQPSPTITVDPGFPSYPGISSNTSGWPSTGNGATVATPSGNSTWGSTTTGGPIPISPDGIDSGNSGGGWGGSGVGGTAGTIQFPTPIPLPVGPTAAIIGSILLSNGNIFGGGGGIGGVLNSAGNIANNPVGSVTSSIDNLGNSIGSLVGPQPLPGAVNGAIGSGIIGWPSGSGGGGAPPAPSEPVDSGGGPSYPEPTGGPIGIVPVGGGGSGGPPPPNQGTSGGNTIAFPNGGGGQNSGSTVAIWPTTPTEGGNGSTTILPGGGNGTGTPGGGVAGPTGPTRTDSGTPTGGGTTIIPTTGGTPTPGDTHTPPPGSTAIIPTPTPGGTTAPTGVTPTITITPQNNPTMATPPLPNPRSYYNEGNQSTQDLSALYPGISNLYGNASRSYGTNDYANFGNILGQYGTSNGQLTNLANQQTAASNTALRQGNVNDAGALGGQALGYLQQLNPNQYSSLNQANQQAASGIQQSPYQAQLGAQFGAGPSYSTVNPYTSFNGVQTGFNAGQVNPNTSYNNVQTGFNAPAVNANTGFNGVQAQQGDMGLGYAGYQLGQGGPSDIQQSLEQQARSQLALGGSLSAQDQNQAQQSAREAWSARGLVNSPGAVGAEILNTDALSRQRLAERTASAQQIDATGFNQRQQGFSNALGYSNAAQNYAGQGLQAQQSNLQAQLTGNQLGYQSQAANQNAALQAQQMGLQGQLANQSAGLQSNQLGYQGQVANQNAGLQAQQLGLQGQQSNLQAQLAGNQQGLQAGLANQNAGLQAQQQNYNLGTSLMGSDYARQQQNYGNVLQNAQLQSQNAFNPFNTITSANTANQGTNQNLFGQTAGLSSGAYGNQFVQNAFNPYNTYSQDIYGTNFNAANAQYISGQNNQAALQGANTQANASLLNNFLGSLAGLYGSGVGSCWVARAVFGEDSPKVQKFRRWMLTRGPKWFRNLYIKHGEAFAAWLEDHAWLKPAIRAIMENKIAALHRYDHALAA